MTRRDSDEFQENVVREEAEPLVTDNHCGHGLCHGEAGVKISIQIPAGAIKWVELKFLDSENWRLCVGGEEADVAHKERRSRVPMWICSVGNSYEISVGPCQAVYTSSEKSCGQEAYM